MIKQRLSLLNLFAMDGGGIIITILLSYPVVSTLCVYYFRSKLADYPAYSSADIFRYPIGTRVMFIVIAVYWILLFAVLFRMGKKNNQTSVYAISRLCVSEYEYCIWQTVYGVIVFAAFYCMILVGIYIAKEMCLENDSDLTSFDIYVSFRNSVHTRFFLPLGDKTQKWVLILSGLGSALVGSSDCCRARHGARRWLSVVYIYTAVYTGIYGLNAHKSVVIGNFSNWNGAQILCVIQWIAAMAVGIWGAVSMIKNKEEKIENKEIY